MKWGLGADWLIAAEAYPGFCSMKRLGVFLLPLDGMLVHRRSLPRNLLGFPNNSPVHSVPIQGSSPDRTNHEAITPPQTLVNISVGVEKRF